MPTPENKGHRIPDQLNRNRMHEDEFEINLSLVRRLVAEQFPRLASRSITEVRTKGTVNALFRLGKDLCVRLPRLKNFIEGLERELTWLPRLANHISLAIPTPLDQGEPTEWYPSPWAIYRWIEGVTYQDSRIRDEQLAAHDLANFILELRNVDMHGAPRGGRAPLMALDEITRAAIVSSHGVIDTKSTLEAWAQMLKTPPWYGNPVWIHGDLLRPNLLVRGGKLHAVIDFGGVGIGDPAFDVIPAWSVFNKIGRDTFRQLLDVDDDIWNRARAYALHQAVRIIPYYPVSNPQFVTLAKRTVIEILSDLGLPG